MGFFLFDTENRFMKKMQLIFYVLSAEGHLNITRFIGGCLTGGSLNPGCPLLCVFFTVYIRKMIRSKYCKGKYSCKVGRC